MIARKSPALMIKETDIDQLLLEWCHVTHWVRAHISQRRPAHRYEGDLLLEDQRLVFRGRDLKDGKNYEEIVALDRIISVYPGFSKLLEGSSQPSFGIGGQVPLVVRYHSDAGEQTAYLHVCHDHYPLHLASGNLDWYEALRDAIHTAPQRQPVGARSGVLVA